jgi:hypothetical protein
MKSEDVVSPYAYRMWDEADGTWIVFSTDPKLIIREDGEFLGPMAKKEARYMVIHMNYAHEQATKALIQNAETAEVCVKVLKKRAEKAEAELAKERENFQAAMRLLDDALASAVKGECWWSLNNHQMHLVLKAELDKGSE